MRLDHFMERRRGGVEEVGKEWRVVRRERIYASDSLWFPIVPHSLTTHSYAFVCQSIPFLDGATFFPYVFLSQLSWGCCCAGDVVCCCILFVADGWMLVILCKSLIRWWMVCWLLVPTYARRTHTHTRAHTKLNFYLNFRYVTNRTDIDLW